MPPGLPIPQVTDFIKRVEDAGFDGVGVPEREIQGRDVYVLLTMAAMKTSHITLYPAVTNPLTRHPLILASLAHSLEEVAPGRVRITVGSGDTSALYMGRPPASVEEMRSAVVMMRRLLAGEAVPIGNNPEVRLLHTTTPPTPVYITATGPRMIELAGEVADGAMLMVGLLPDLIREARSRLQQGARKAGRDLHSFPVIFVVPVVIDEDLEAARERARQTCFMWLERPWRVSLLRYRGLDIPDVKRPEDIPSKTLAEMCDLIGLVGPAEYCAERLQRAISESGVDHIFCQSAIHFEMPESIVEGFRKVIMAKVK